MSAAPDRRPAPPPALTRFAALAPLTDEDRAALTAAIAMSRRLPSRCEIIREGREIAEPRLIVSGWAARVRLIADGRRQFLGFLLPGDLIGLCRQPAPLAVSTVIALTEVSHCPIPPACDWPRLAQAYAMSEALGEAYLLAHIVRLGRLNAQERIGDLLLELHERLALADQADTDGFDLPLTQEILADALGLTSVHVNRMLQVLRREGDVIWKGRRLMLPDRAVLSRKVDRTPVRVSGVPSVAARQQV